MHKVGLYVRGYMDSFSFSSAYCTGMITVCRYYIPAVWRCWTYMDNVRDFVLQVNFDARDWDKMMGNYQRILCETFLLCGLLIGSLLRLGWFMKIDDIVILAQKIDEHYSSAKVKIIEEERDLISKDSFFVYSRFYFLFFVLSRWELNISFIFPTDFFIDRILYSKTDSRIHVAMLTI